MSNGPVIRSIGTVTAPEAAYWRVNVTAWLDPSNLKLQDTIHVELSDPKSGLILVSRKKINLARSADKIELDFLVAKVPI